MLLGGAIIIASLDGPPLWLERGKEKEHFPQNHIWRLFLSQKTTPPLLINASLRREAPFPTQGGKSGKRKMTLRASACASLACFNFANPAPLFFSAPKTFRGNGFNSCYIEREKGGGIRRLFLPLLLANTVKYFSSSFFLFAGQSTLPSLLKRTLREDCICFAAQSTVKR